MYRLVLKGAARRALDSLERGVPAAFKRLVVEIAALGAHPRPRACEKLKTSDVYRVRVGDHRILYLVDDERRVVTVLDVAHRKDAYR